MGKRLHILCLGILLCSLGKSFQVFAQTQTGELLLNEQLQELTRRLGDETELAEWEAVEKEQALQQAQRITKRAEILKLPKQQGKALMHQAMLTYSLKLYPECLVLLDSALTLHYQLGDLYGRANIEYLYGKTFARLGAFEVARMHYIEAILFYEELGEKLGLASAQNNLGILLESLGGEGLTQAKALYTESLSLKRKYGKSDILVANTLLNLGSVCNKLGMRKGQSAYLDSAYQYHQKALRFCKQVGYTHGLAIAYNNLGALAEKRGQFEQAELAHKQALALRLPMGDSAMLLSSLMNLGVSKEKRGQIDSALHYYSLAETYVSKAEKHPISDSEAKLYFNKAIAYYAKDDQANALDYLYEHLMKKDDLNKSQGKVRREAIALLEKKKINQRLSSLKQENELQQSQKQNILVLSVLVILTGAVFFAFFFRYQEDQRKEERERLVDELKEKEQAAIDALIEGEEKEKKRIAIELHDGIGAFVAAIKNHTETLRDSISGLPEDSQKRYDRILSLLCQLINDVREQSHNLGAFSLRENGFLPAIKEICDLFHNEKQLNVVLDVEGLDREPFSQVIQLNVYRILQELFSNIVKHARATEVQVGLSYHDNELVLIVRDNGRGFQYTKGTARGMGLENIQGRVKQLGGTCDFFTALGEGTEVEVRIPIHSEEAILLSNL